METMYERCQKVMPPVANRATTLGVVQAAGPYIYTEDQRKILDFASGVAVNNLGHNHPQVVAAIEKQLQTLVHGGHNVVYYESYVRLAEKLVELTGGETMAYFSNSGAEANDGALKLAKHVTKRPAVIAFRGGFHGRTIGATSVTASNAKYRKNYEGLLPSVYFLDFPNLYRHPYEKGTTEDCPAAYFQQFEKLFEEVIDPYSVAAILMEPIQGEGGYIVPPASFLKYVREICDKYGICLIFDEVQTGFGRTGYFFASEYFDVEPDIRTVAKGIANGLPLSAIIAKKSLMEQWTPGAHGGTFGGNPLACAAALAVIDVLETEGLANSQKVGRFFKQALLDLQKKYTVIGDVRGVGLMLAIELVDSEQKPDAALTSRIIQKALAHNLLLLTCGTQKNVVRFMPPVIITENEVKQVIAILTEILEEEYGHL